MIEKKLLKFAKLSLYAKRKRIRKKAWNRLVELCGYNNHGYIMYSKVHKYIKKAKGTRIPSKK